MNKQVLIITTGPRKGGNSQVLADEFARGAIDAGHEVNTVSLHDKTISFCKGCFACQKDNHCIIPDDVEPILDSLSAAHVVVFATPIYFYEMCGQMKTLIDRCNPLFETDYAFRDVYLLATAADSAPSAIDGAISGLNGWVSCFSKSALKGSLCATSVTNLGDIKQQSHILNAAYEMGKSI